ncbi:MAG: hypothetical protein WC755_00400 [Candidatus Woesearchaeota archaeon]|jgi:hypothetical protein
MKSAKGNIEEKGKINQPEATFKTPLEQNNSIEPTPTILTKTPIKTVSDEEILISPKKKKTFFSGSSKEEKLETKLEENIETNPSQDLRNEVYSELLTFYKSPYKTFVSFKTDDYANQYLTEMYYQRRTLEPIKEFIVDAHNLQDLLWKFITSNMEDTDAKVEIANLITNNFSIEEYTKSLRVKKILDRTYNPKKHTPEEIEIKPESIKKISQSISDKLNNAETLYNKLVEYQPIIEKYNNFLNDYIIDVQTAVSNANTSIKEQLNSLSEESKNKLQINCKEVISLYSILIENISINNPFAVENTSDMFEKIRLSYHEKIMSDTEFYKFSMTNLQAVPEITKILNDLEKYVKERITKIHDEIKEDKSLLIMSKYHKDNEKFPEEPSLFEIKLQQIK